MTSLIDEDINRLLEKNKFIMWSSTVTAEKEKIIRDLRIRVKKIMENMFKINNENKSIDWGQKILYNNLLKTHYEYVHLHYELNKNCVPHDKKDEIRNKRYIKIKNKLNECRMRKKSISIYESIQILKLPTEILFKISTEMLTLPI